MFDVSRARELTKLSRRAIIDKMITESAEQGFDAVFVEAPQLMNDPQLWSELKNAGFKVSACDTFRSISWE